MDLVVQSWRRFDHDAVLEVGSPAWLWTRALLCPGEQQQRPGCGARTVAGQVRRRHQPAALARQRGHSAEVAQGQVQASQVRPVLGLRGSHVHRYPGREGPLPQLPLSKCIYIYLHMLQPIFIDGFIDSENEVWLMKREAREFISFISDLLS